MSSSFKLHECQKYLYSNFQETETSSDVSRYEGMSESIGRCNVTSKNCLRVAQHAKKKLFTEEPSNEGEDICHSKPQSPTRKQDDSKHRIRKKENKSKTKDETKVVECSSESQIGEDEKKEYLTFYQSIIKNLNSFYDKHPDLKHERSESGMTISCYAAQARGVIGTRSTRNTHTRNAILEFKKSIEKKLRSTNRPLSDDIIDAINLNCSAFSHFSEAVLQRNTSSYTCAKETYDAIELHLIRLHRLLCQKQLNQITSEHVNIHEPYENIVDYFENGRGMNIWKSVSRLEAKLNANDITLACELDETRSHSADNSSNIAPSEISTDANPIVRNEVISQLKDLCVLLLDITEGFVELQGEIEKAKEDKELQRSIISRLETHISSLLKTKAKEVIRLFETEYYAENLSQQCADTGCISGEACTQISQLTDDAMRLLQTCSNVIYGFGRPTFLCLKNNIPSNQMGTYRMAVERLIDQLGVFV